MVLSASSEATAETPLPQKIGTKHKQLTKFFLFIYVYHFFQKYSIHILGFTFLQIVMELVMRGVRCLQGQGCARGHAGRAARGATACRRGRLGTTMLVHAMPT